MKEIEFAYNGKNYIVGELKVPNGDTSYDIGCVFEVQKKDDNTKLHFVTYFFGVKNKSTKVIIDTAKVVLN